MLGRSRMRAHALGDPICICANDADQCSILVDEGVSGKDIVELDQAEIGQGRPAQCAVHVSRPDPPFRSVLEFDRVGFLMRLDKHGLVTQLRIGLRRA